MMMKTLAAALALTSLALATGAEAQALRKGETSATLASPLKKPFYDVIDGRMWDCSGTTCHANPQGGMSAQSLARECASAAKKLGAFATYQTGDKTVEGDALTACNAGAKKAS